MEREGGEEAGGITSGETGGEKSVMCDLTKHSFVLPSLYRMYVNVYNNSS